MVITKTINRDILVGLFFFLLFYMAKCLLTAVLLADLLDRIFLVCEAIEPLHNSVGKLTLIDGIMTQKHYWVVKSRGRTYQLSRIRIRCTK